ncbi:MAG: hypothetical protein KatS3mg107_0045 [Gemmataceae bacterium]|nr:MAG: hypothetical protein KatS3mg107_0045 [Gemmataceae bacterium]
MDVQELEAKLQRVEPAVRLISERHLLQVLYYLTDWGYPYPLHPALPYWVSRTDLEAMGTLPESVFRGKESSLLLVTTPDDRLLDHLPAAALLRAYWRVLFQAAIARQWEQRFQQEGMKPQDCWHLLERWGPATAREILHVLTEEHLLPENASASIVYRTFSAVYLDLAFFDPEHVSDFFPSLPAVEQVRAELAREIGAEEILFRTRPEGAAEAYEPPPIEEHWWELPTVSDSRVMTVLSGSERLSGASRRHSADLETLKRQTAEAIAQRNWIRAAILQMRRAGLETAEEEQRRAYTEAEDALRQVVAGLGQLWQWDEAMQNEWQQALRPLLPLAACGGWPRAARCLYELQKLQSTLQRDVYTVDLVEFLATLGRRPIVRPLPHARWVRQLISLQKARRQMQRSGLSPAARLRLDQLFAHQIQQLEHSVRERLAPLIRDCLQQAGLVPTSVVEEVGREKLIAELLDQICTSGYARFGHLRDAVARNTLKLPDLQGLGEWFRGDGLLRADALLAEALDGIYHRGEIYLRGLQRFSALFFGTVFGRWLTLYLALPFGGAFLILMFLEEVRHLGEKAIHLFVPGITAPALPTVPLPNAISSEMGVDSETGLAVAPPPRAISVPPDDDWTEEWDVEDPAGETAAPASSSSPTSPDGTILWYGSEPGSALVTGVLTSSAAVTTPEKHQPSWLVAPPTIIAVGIFLLLLLHVAPFRRFVVQFLWRAGVLLRLALWDGPRALWRAPLFRSLRQSRPIRFLFHHFWTPTILTLLCYLVLILLGVSPVFLFDWLWMVIWAGLTIAYNTPWGWVIQDRIAEALADWWRQVRVNLLPGLISVFIDWFHRLVNWVERGLYAVDEWLRYRRGDSRGRVALKAVLGLLWFPVAYTFRFVFYLLVEPQVNPIKHFPVVTVSHKVIWPLVPQIADWTGISVWTVSMIINGIPGIFGFIAWELKENWRLYAANRPRRLSPVVIGSHGETMRGLLRPGFHSGTLPRCYRKLRRAQTRDKQHFWRQRLHHVVDELQHFVERECLALLHRVAKDSLPLHLDHIQTGCRRVTVSFHHPHLGPVPLQLAFEEMEGRIHAEIVEWGWTRRLSDEQRSILILAFRGLLDKAAVEVYATRQRLELDVPLAKDFDDLRRHVAWKEWQEEWDRALQAKPLAASA